MWSIPRELATLPEKQEAIMPAMEKAETMAPPWVPVRPMDWANLLPQVEKPLLTNINIKPLRARMICWGSWKKALTPSSRPALPAGAGALGVGFTKKKRQRTTSTAKRLT